MKYFYALITFIVIFSLPFLATVVASYIFDFKLKDIPPVLQIIITCIAFIFGAIGSLIFLEENRE